ncbi:MAG: ribose 5-phosphate isomerase B [Tepidanaerobacteraceae bacterium]|nr:ribose 5-phosphate isomerase B [Tepidanaerobacteraceae bacterium]
MMEIAIGSDHAGYELKRQIIEHLIQKGVEVKDFGSYSTERCDYPVYGYKVAKAVASGECEKGILICGTGVGISLAANKVKGIRAVVCSEPYSAQLSRRHNNTNVLALGARVVGSELARMIVDCWLEAEYEGGRHQKRIDMIAEIENDEFDI